MTTLRVRSNPLPLSMACSRAALLAAVGMAAAVVSAPALAQTADGLRGPVLEDGALRILPSQRQRLPGQPQADAARPPTPAYRPVSQGALPDEPTTPELDGFVATSPATATSNDLTAARTVRRTAGRRENTGDEGEQAVSDSSDESTRAETNADAGEQTDDDLTTGTVRTGRVDAGDLERNVAAEAEAERARAMEAQRAETEDEPYAAPGIRVGSFILRPTLEQGIEWTSNAQSTASGSSDFLSRTSLGLEAASDWSRHSAALSLNGTYRTSITGSGFSEFTGSAAADVGLDVGNDYRINAGAGYSRGPEEATSPSVISGTLSRPLRQTLTGSLGVEKHSGLLRAALTGNVERSTYGVATLSTGGSVSQADRNNTLYSATLRGGYEISPALVPFVEVEYGRRLYDQRLDAGGFARSANRYGARAGVEFDMGEKLDGELSAGWITEKLDDTRLAAISAFSLDADINWSPIRGTIVNLNAGTDIEGSTTAGSSGSVLYDASLSVTRELRANLTATALIGAGWRRYAASSDRDTTLNGELSLTWWMNRYAGIRGRASHERVSSNVAGRNSQTTTVYLGLTLRR